MLYMIQVAKADHSYAGWLLSGSCPMFMLNEILERDVQIVGELL